MAEDDLFDIEEIAEDAIEEIEDIVKGEVIEITGGNDVFDKIINKAISKAADKVFDGFFKGGSVNKEELERAERGQHQKENFRAQQIDARNREKARRDDERHALEMKKLELEIARLAAVDIETAETSETPSFLFGELPSLPISPCLQCEDNPEDFTTWLNSLVARPCRIVILGSQGYGKSALGHALLEYLHYKTGRSAILYAPLVLNKKLLPKWLMIVDDWDSIPENALVLVDEAALMLNSRNPGCRANRDFTELSAVSRHKNLSLIFVSQSSRSLDINAMSMGDLEIIFKKPPMFAGINERKEMKDMSKMAKKALDKIDAKVLREYSVVFPSSYEPMLMKSGLSSYWNENVSTMYKDCVGSSQPASDTLEAASKKEEILKLSTEGKTQIEISQKLGIDQSYVSRVISGKK